MDIQETASELQKFADANGLNIDVSEVLNTMDAGDFITINQAMDNSDNRTIMQVLQKYKAQMSESYKLFSENKIIESSEVNQLNTMTTTELESFYKQNCSFALRENSHLTLAEMKTLVFDELSEDLASTLNASQISNKNTQTQQTQINPQTAAKLKQAELQKNASNSNFKVTVPGSSSGTSEVAPVVGVDVGQTTDQTLVVTKDPTKSNQVNVFGLNDVEPVQEETEEFVEPCEHSEEIEQIESPEDTDSDFGSMLDAIVSTDEGDEAEIEELLIQVIQTVERMKGR